MGVNRHGHEDEWIVGSVMEERKIKRRKPKKVLFCEGFGSDAPDTAVGFIAIRVGGGNFVVGNNFVIPVGDVEEAVGAELDVDRAEPVVLGSQ